MVRCVSAVRMMEVRHGISNEMAFHSPDVLILCIGMRSLLPVMDLPLVQLRETYFSQVIEANPGRPLVIFFR